MPRTPAAEDVQAVCALMRLCVDMSFPAQKEMRMRQADQVKRVLDLYFAQFEDESA